MRALCGAIITAGALIGLGFAAMGLGTRYSNYVTYDDKGNANLSAPVDWHHIDSAMLLIVVVLVATLLIGLATAFIGLMFHHHRRHHELLAMVHNHEHQRVAVP